MGDIIVCHRRLRIGSGSRHRQECRDTAGGRTRARHAACHSQDPLQVGRQKNIRPRGAPAGRAHLRRIDGHGPGRKASQRSHGARSPRHRSAGASAPGAGGRLAARLPQPTEALNERKAALRIKVTTKPEGVKPPVSAGVREPSQWRRAAGKPRLMQRLAGTGSKAEPCRPPVPAATQPAPVAPAPILAERQTAGRRPGHGCQCLYQCR